MKNRIAAAILTATIILSGCAGLPGTDNPGTSTVVTTEESPVQSDTPTPATNTTNETEIPDATEMPEINNSSAVNRALDAEEEYVASILRNASCGEYWGTEATVETREGDVVNRSADGVSVDVQQPYWFEEGDSASHATYLVTKNETQRLEGDDISPCYSGP